MMNILDVGYDASKFKHETSDDRLERQARRLKRTDETKTVASRNFGECNFIKLEENLIIAFMDAEIFKIKLSLEGAMDDDIIELYFGNIKTIQDRAHRTRQFSRFFFLTRMSTRTVDSKEHDNEISISYRKYKTSDTNFGNFLRVESNKKSIFFGSIILPRVFILIATSKKQKFEYIEVDINPRDDFNIIHFKDSIDVQEEFV